MRLLLISLLVLTSCSKPDKKTGAPVVEGKIEVEELGRFDSDSCFGDARMLKITTQDNQIFYAINDCHGTIFSR